MARIIILDDSMASSAFLKMTLTGHRHRVSRTAMVQDVINCPSSSTPDLVLINQAFGNNSGWKIFNRLKRISPKIPAMVYVLEPLSAVNAGWIIKAVQTVVREAKDCDRTGLHGSSVSG